MQPVGGLTLIIHLAIIVMVQVKKAATSFFRSAREVAANHTIPTVITLCVLAIVALNTFNSLNSSINANPNFYVSAIGQFFGFSWYSCTPMNIQPGENEVILRIDDIQSYAWSGIVTRMVDDSMERQVPLVMGVIPFGIENDKSLLTLIKKNQCNLEIAQHGWSNDKNAHNIVEIEKLSSSKIYQDVIEARSELEKATGANITTFIPPNNIYSTKTAEVIQKANFSVVSSDNKGIYDSTTLTYDYQKNEPYPLEKTLAACDEKFVQGLPCIIMIHPQDYATDGKLDEEKYANYLKLIDELKKRNATFVRFIDIVNKAYPSGTNTY